METTVSLTRFDILNLCKQSNLSSDMVFEYCDMIVNDYEVLKAVLPLVDSLDIPLWQKLLLCENHMITDIVGAPGLPDELHEFCLMDLHERIIDENSSRFVQSVMMVRPDLAPDLAERWLYKNAKWLNLYDYVIEKSRFVNFEVLKELCKLDYPTGNVLTDFQALAYVRFLRNKNCTEGQAKEIIRLLIEAKDGMHIDFVFKINANIIISGNSSCEMMRFLLERFDKLNGFFQSQLVKLTQDAIRGNDYGYSIM